MMMDGNVTAGYNALNQPMMIWSANNPGGKWLWFGFDPLGRCVKRWYAQADGSAPGAATYFAYDGWNLVQEGYSPWTSTRFYIHGSRVDEIVQSYNAATGLLAYHYYDASGHCTMLTNTQGTIKEQVTYDAFGYPHFFGSSNNWTGELGSSAHGNRFLFTGREWLSELRLYDFRNRLYNPELGRFMQPDPKELAAGDYNLYRYCHNDPVNRNDPFGLAPVDVDQETDALAHQALNLNLTAMQNTQWLGGLLFRYEFGTAVLQNAQGRFLSETRTDKLLEHVSVPEAKEGERALVDTHNHTYDTNNLVTHVNTSDGDVKVGDRTGRPQYVITPSGTRERYRPSDKKTETERKEEGGILERWKDGRWQRIPGANTDTKNPGSYRNGY